MTSAEPKAERQRTAASGAAVEASNDEKGVQQRALKPSDIVAGCVWFGVGPAGRSGEERLSQEEVDRAVAAAAAAGIREFDTAPKYGSGTSEERLGRALARCAATTPGLRVLTKVGRLLKEADVDKPCGPFFSDPAAPPRDEQEVAIRRRRIVNDYSAAGAKASLRESLARMGLKGGGIHGLRVHDPNDNETCDPSVCDEVAACAAADGCIAALRELRAEGEIQEVSLGMNCNKEAHMGAPEEIIRLISLAPPDTFDVALLAGGWNLISQAGLPCLMECRRRGIAVHLAGIYCSGLLVGGTTYSYVEAPPEKLEKRVRWQALAEKHGVSLPAVAIAFAALPTAVSRLVIGMATEAEVRQNMDWVEESSRVPPKIWQEARDTGLLPEELPLPTDEEGCPMAEPPTKKAAPGGA